MRRLFSLLAALLVATYAHGSQATLPGSTLLWSRQGAPTPAASQLLEEMRTADTRGLRPSDYQASALSHRAASLSHSSPAEQQAFDASLSSAARRLVADLHDGRVKPKEVGYDLDVRKPPFDAAGAVQVLAHSQNVAAELDRFEPQLGHYALLKTALARYRALAAANARLTSLPPLPRARVREGEQYNGAAALRALLVAFGDVPNEVGAQPLGSAEARLDSALVAGLRAFQVRHGLEPDGVLGKSTFRALTTPLSARVYQIELSLERMRWLPSQLDSPPIIVNIPQFRLFAFRTTQDAASDILQMNVIVGQAFKARRTPVFAADMKYVVLNPYWDVPRSILVNELLPDIERDPSWLEAHGYEMVRGESDDAAVMPATRESVALLKQGKLRVRQRPGPANALGRVKFMFPNRHNVYLHDTPAQALFQRSSRAFSHGCIRVSDPLALLAHVMRDDPSWTAAREEAAFSSARPVRVTLRQPIRVFIMYGTALATEAGSVMFFDDIYQQDAPLLARLAARAP